MFSGSVPVLTCVLLLLALRPDVLARRSSFGGAGGRWGAIGRAGGGGDQYKAPHVYRGSSSLGSSAGKVAGAAVAGALGGMVIGRGLGSVSRSGYEHDRVWYRGYDSYGGHGNGQVRHDAGAGFRNETDMQYYVGAASRGQPYSCVLMFGAVSFLFGYWSS